MNQDHAVALQGLQAAFPAAPLALETAFSGDGASYLDAESFIAGAQGKSWQDLDAVFLEQHHDAVHFLSAPAFVACLPAFLKALIDDTDNLDMLPDFVLSSLTRPLEDPAGQSRFDARVRQLTPPQQQAVAKALAYLDELYGEFEENPARKAREFFTLAESL